MASHPVILDTDIGSDIDDTWALVQLLNSPELDLKMVVTTNADTTYRARLTAKLLELAGRTDVPVAVGPPDHGEASQGQLSWLGDYQLKDYPGKVHEDGVAAMVECAMSAKESVTIVAIGPLGNVAKALDTEPKLPEHCHFAGMQGCIRRFWERDEEIPEYNVMCDIPASKKVFAAKWISAAITPLDSCGLVVVKPERYARLRACKAPLCRALMQNVDIWRQKGDDPNTSSRLYDTVAVHLAHSREFLEMERMGIRVDDKGSTLADDSAPPVDVAVGWKDLDGYLDDLVKRLTLSS